MAVNSGLAHQTSLPHSAGQRQIEGYFSHSILRRDIRWPVGPVWVSVGAVNFHLNPKLAVVAEPLSIGVIGSGIGLAQMLGLWADPSIWLWGALVIGILTFLNGFGPLFSATTKMVVELDKEEPDGDRLESLFGKALQWSLLQTVFMIVILAMMVGLRGMI